MNTGSIFAQRGALLRAIPKVGKRVSGKAEARSTWKEKESG